MKIDKIVIIRNEKGKSFQSFQNLNTLTDDLNFVLKKLSNKKKKYAFAIQL